MKTKNLLFLISFLEGGALMAAELISAKLMGPYYGSSLIVWTSVFVCTLSGLALGYFLGGKYASKNNLPNLLLKILLFGTIYFALMAPLSAFMMEFTLNFPIEIGSLLSVLVFLFPLLVSFGMVSPIIISHLTENIANSGQNSGTIYTISTLGGIFISLFCGLYAIPILGLKVSILISSGLLLIATLSSYLIIKNKQ